jgi:hypothetical protein
MDLVVNLPEEKEIESTAEFRVSSESNIIRKTIRYKNGLVVELLQDFDETIFHVSFSTNQYPLRLVKKPGFR